MELMRIEHLTKVYGSGENAVHAVDDVSFSVSFTSALTCVSNVGPGLDLVGPAGNFSTLSALSKGVLSACMVIGRLEIMPVLVLFSRGAWRRT